MNLKLNSTGSGIGLLKCILPNRYCVAPGVQDNSQKNLYNKIDPARSELCKRNMA